jgi:hypothetical protein
MPARRTNARRTWPDGSGCEQRPLFPCSPGCRGWDLFDTEHGQEVERCDDCRTFDDDEDAREHVLGCRTCREDLAEMKRPRGRRGSKAHPGNLLNNRVLPGYRARKLLCDFFYDSLYDDPLGRWDLESLPDPSDGHGKIEEFMFRVGAGDYDFNGADGDGYESPRDAAWWALRDWAGDDFTDYMRGMPAIDTRDWEE